MKLHLTTLLLAGLSLSVSAQSIGSLTPELDDSSSPGEATTAAPEEVATAEFEQPVVAKTNPELINEPSRYAGIDLETYLQTISSTFSMRTRERDPFGRHQDPSYKPPVPKAPTRKIPKYKPAPVTPFEDIVEAIRITTIIPSQGAFLVDGRSFRVGDEIKLNTGNGKIISVHVVGVNSDSVRFRHGTTNETAEHSLRLLPGGMQRGGGGSIRPRGITSPDDQAPIDISGSGAGTSLSSSR